MADVGTMRRYRQGLVVGKFCPLHRGHMHLIQRAVDDCDAVLVLSYTKPGFEGHDRARRQHWLDTIFPQVRALVVDDASLADLCRERGLAPRALPHDEDDADTHRAFCAWLCTVICGVTADAVFTSEDYGDGFAQSLARAFGHAVDHVCVDRARVAVPISGTRVRADPHAQRRFLDPAVYASFVQRICLLGGESSGKTTLAAALARHLGTEWAPEFGRELWEAQGGALAYVDLLRIATTQAAREDALQRSAKRWLVCDSSPLTTLFYSLDGFGRADPELRRLSWRPYDRTFLCAPDFPFVQDGTRRDAAFRDRQFRWYAQVLAARGVPYVLLAGPVERRIATVCGILDAQA